MQISAMLKIVTPVLQLLVNQMMLDNYRLEVEITEVTNVLSDILSWHKISKC